MYFASLGLLVTAVDRDKYMLRHARHLAGQRVHDAGAIKFVTVAMREQNAFRCVDLGICLGGSFNSLLTEAAASKTLTAVSAVLPPAGVFLVELHEPRAT